MSKYVPPSKRSKAAIVSTFDVNTLSDQCLFPTLGEVTPKSSSINFKAVVDERIRLDQEAAERAGLPPDYSKMSAAELAEQGIVVLRLKPRPADFCEAYNARMRLREDILEEHLLTLW